MLTTRQELLGSVHSVTIRRPSNFHTHFRQDDMLEAVFASLIRIPRYVLAMPNTGPIVTVDQMITYYGRLRELAYEVADHNVDFVMTLYLSPNTTPSDIEQMARLPFPCGVKYYPPEQGATTGSGIGVPLTECENVLRAMAANTIPLLGHFESVKDKNGNVLPPAEREGYMVDNVLWGFRDEHPDLRISFEHASTRKAVGWYRADSSGKSFITVTPQHSLLIQPDREHFGYDLDCMPVVKGEDDREAIIDLITSGHGGAGGDEAPHPHQKKLEGAHGCWTPHAPEMYAEVFDSRGKLGEPEFERFMSLNAPAWWGLPLPDELDTITFVRKEGVVPDPLRIPNSDDVIVPLGWSPDGSLYRTKFQVI